MLSKLFCYCEKLVQKVVQKLFKNVSSCVKKVYKRYVYKKLLAFYAILMHNLINNHLLLKQSINLGFYPFSTSLIIKTTSNIIKRRIVVIL